MVYELETLVRSHSFLGPSSNDLCPVVFYTTERPKGDSLLLSIGAESGVNHCRHCLTDTVIFRYHYRSTYGQSQVPLYRLPPSFIVFP